MEDSLVIVWKHKMSSTKEAPELKGEGTSCSSYCHWALKVLPFSAVTGQARLFLLVLSAAA